MGMVGLGGGQGQYFQPQTGNESLSTLNEQMGAGGLPQTQRALQGYANGGMSLQDAMAGDHNLNGNQLMGLQQELSTNALTGSKMATDQVQNNAIFGQLFGKNGSLSNAVNKEQDLQNQGFQLKPEDIEAYGQTSGNIARMFGQGENQLAQSLANRGLSSAPSGAAGAQFSGLMGNKNEQLAQAQMAIANQRMQNTMQRIGQQQQFISQLGGQAGGAIQDQFGRQMAGVNSQRSGLESAAGLTTGSNAANNQALMASLEDKRAAEGQTLMGGLGKGLYSSAVKVGDSPGTGSEAFSSSFGSALGSGLGGGAMGGMGGGAKKPPAEDPTKNMQSTPQTYHSKYYGDIGS